MLHIKSCDMPKLNDPGKAGGLYCKRLKGALNPVSRLTAASYMIYPFS